MADDLKVDSILIDDALNKIRNFVAIGTIGLILYGDVYLGVTLPASMFAVVLIFFLSFPPEPRLLLPLAVVPIMGLGAIIALQIIMGTPPRGKADLTLYLPLFYAALFMLALHRLTLDQALILRGLKIGGVLSASTMILMAVFVPVDKFLIPGQDSLSISQEFDRAHTNRSGSSASLDPGSASAANKLTDGASTLLDPGSPSIATKLARISISESAASFYTLKAAFRNALGRSNYIASFFVFLGCVFLVCRLPIWSAVFFILSMLTFSRLAIVFVGMIFAVMTTGHLLKRNVKQVALVFLLFAAINWCALFLFGDYLSGLPGFASMEIRRVYWTSVLSPIAEHPIIGAPRSYVLDSLNANIVWNAHSSILSFILFFGLFGLALYSAYIWIALREIYNRPLESRLWTGSFVAVITLLAWSLFEPIALSPAFEITIATLYILARNERLSGAVQKGAHAVQSSTLEACKLNPRSNRELGAR